MMGWRGEWLKIAIVSLTEFARRLHKYKRLLERWRGRPSLFGKQKLLSSAMAMAFCFQNKINKFLIYVHTFFIYKSIKWHNMKYVVRRVWSKKNCTRVIRQALSDCLIFRNLFKLRTKDLKRSCNIRNWHA